MIYRYYDLLDRIVYEVSDEIPEERCVYPEQENKLTTTIQVSPHTKTVTFVSGTQHETYYGVVFQVNPELQHYAFKFMTYIDPGKSPVFEVSRKFALANISTIVGIPEDTIENTDDQIIESNGYLL